MSYILFDVGANWGEDSLTVTRNDTNVITWAFEPTPELYQDLIKASLSGRSFRGQDHGPSYSDRYHVVPIALSDFDGEATFNIADNPDCDWGCSSLNQFSDNLNQSWPGRTDFQFNRSITVQVSRLDTWFKTNNIQLDRIDYFHCDTQGSDLKVLQGMGDYITLIQAGVVECARNNDVKLYKENHTREEMIEFLNSKGFTITNERSNDVWSNEINLYFKKI